MKRHRRILVASLAAFALAFAQLAVSAHACALHGAPAEAEVMAHHVQCDGMAGTGEAPPGENVCVEHCLYGDDAVNNLPAVSSIAAAVGPPLRIEPATQPAMADARPAWRYIPAAAPPPPAILFGVLRI